MDEANLVFEGSWPPPADLLFGGDATGEPGRVDVALAGTFDELTVRVRVSPSEKVSITGHFDEMTVAAIAQYHSNTARPLVCHTTSSHQTAGRLQSGVDLTHQRAKASPAGWHSPHTRADRLSAWIESKTPRVLIKSRSNFASAHEPGTPVRPGVEVRHQDADRTLRLLLNSAFEAASLRRAWTTFRHQDGTKTRTERRTAHQEASLTGRWIVTSAQLATPMSRQWYADHEDAMRPPPGISYPPVIPVEPPFTCYTPDGKLLFEHLRIAGDTNLVFICEGAPGPDPEPPAQIVVPIRKVYLVINTAILVRVSDGKPIPVTGMSMSLDVDSWTWSFSASGPTSIYDDVARQSGVPTEVQATVNGTAFRFIIESIGRDRTFQRDDLRIGGRGRAALLDSPYSPILNLFAEDPWTSQQLADWVLQDNGVPLGWNVDWNIDAWPVPGGVFAHQGSYIGALNRITEAAGAYMQPHNTADEIIVLPRYPVAPWDWGDVEPDIELPSAVVQHEGTEWAHKPYYNRVYVRGEAVGVNGRVTRTGSAGDMLAPAVVDSLITHADAARQRGISILSDVGQVTTVNLRLPVLSETGIIKPGKFVRYTDGAQHRVGITRSVQVDVSLPTIWQTIAVETHDEPV